MLKDLSPFRVSNQSWRKIAPPTLKYLMAGMLIVFCGVSIWLLMSNLPFLFLSSDVAYGDSYILYDVIHFQKTGTIYRDLSQPPYLPAQYSPLVYILYSLPGRIVAWENPFVGPRLLVLVAFVACIEIVASITRALIPARFVTVWAFLLALSISNMWDWVLQLRGDFFGICFSLLAIRLLMSRFRWSVPLAGILAGLAMQFKITFVAAAIAGALWLLLRRQRKDLATFLFSAIASSAGLYLVYSLREPRMLSQMFALAPGIRDLGGDLRLMNAAMGELVVLLALLGVARVVRQKWPRWTLLVIFGATSFAVAGFTDLQAGGNVNYYFEALFAVVPIAVLGVLHLLNLARRNIILGLLLVGYFGVQFLYPRAQLLYDVISRGRISVQSRNEAHRKLEQTLQSHRVFSTVPNIAMVDANPPLMEPYLLSYLHKLGKADPEPFLREVRSNEYDVVITPATSSVWRGIHYIDPDLRETIAAVYEPRCTLQGMLFHFPKQLTGRSISLADNLASIGCARISPAMRSVW